jgi:hypothetical protein
MKSERDKFNTVKDFDKWLRDSGFTRREARALGFTFRKLLATKDKPKQATSKPVARTIGEILAAQNRPRQGTNG